MRTVCMLANEAADAVNQGVCERRGGRHRHAAGRQLSARAAGLGRGARACGGSSTVLANLAASYGEDRYRVSPLLRRRLLAGGRLT